MKEKPLISKNTQTKEKEATTYDSFKQPSTNNTNYIKPTSQEFDSATSNTTSNYFSTPLYSKIKKSNTNIDIFVKNISNKNGNKNKNERPFTAIRERRNEDNDRISWKMK